MFVCAFSKFALLDGNVAETVGSFVSRLMKVLGAMLATMENNDDVDQNFKKLPRLTLAILNQLVTLLDSENPATENVILCAWLPLFCNSIDSISS